MAFFLVVMRLSGRRGERSRFAKGWGWVACVDVAGGTGRDKSVINIMMVSGQRNKRRVINYRMLEYTDVTETQLAAKIFAECNPERFPNITIAIDGDGLGNRRLI